MRLDEGAIFKLQLPDGREGVVYPLTFGRAKLVVGKPGKPYFDDAW